MTPPSTSTPETRLALLELRANAVEQGLTALGHRLDTIEDKIGKQLFATWMLVAALASAAAAIVASLR